MKIISRAHRRLVDLILYAWWDVVARNTSETEANFTVKSLRKVDYCIHREKEIRSFFFKKKVSILKVHSHSRCNWKWEKC